MSWKPKNPYTEQPPQENFNEQELRLFGEQVWNASSDALLAALKAKGLHTKIGWSNDEKIHQVWSFLRNQVDAEKGAYGTVVLILDE